MGIVGDIVGGLTTGAAGATPTGAITAISSLFETIVERIWQDPAERDKARLALRQMEQTGELQRMTLEHGLLQGQIEVNKIEAASDSLWKSGWRPAAGWACVFGLIYQMLISPLFGWIAINSLGWSSPPNLEMDTLLTLLFGLLGLGWYRTKEKRDGVA